MIIQTDSNSQELLQFAIASQINFGIAYVFILTKIPNMNIYNNGIGYSTDWSFAIVSDYEEKGAPSP